MTHNSWFLSLGFTQMALVLAGFVLLVAVLTRLVTGAGLYLVLEMELRRVRVMLNSLGENSKLAKAVLGQEEQQYIAQLDYRRKNSVGAHRRFICDLTVLSASAVVGVFFSDSWVQALCLMGIFAALWFAASVDIDHCVVPEKTIFIMGVLAIWATLSQDTASWSTPLNVLLGLALTATIVSMSWMLVLFGRETRKDFIILGDGDMIALIALALYFGTDTLIIVGCACLMFVIIFICQKPVCRALRWCGYYPTSKWEGYPLMPFMPSIYLGTVMTVILNEYHEFDKTIELTYQTLVG